MMAGLLPPIEKAEYRETFQWLIALLFAIVFTRGRLISGKQLPLIAKESGEEYIKEILGSIYVPLIAGLDPNKADSTTLLALGLITVLGALSGRGDV